VAKNQLDQLFFRAVTVDSLIDIRLCDTFRSGALGQFAWLQRA
jgi:hypothetical protein